MSIFRRVRGQLSGSNTEQDPHTWYLPNKYSVSTSTTPVNTIPNSAELRNAFIPDPTAPSSKKILVYPDTSHAAVHLCLLECFRNLRREAIRLDIQSYRPPAYAREQTADDGLDDGALPESLRWDLLIQLAVTRFTTWWRSIPQIFSHAAAYDRLAGGHTNLQLGVNYLPPLDVLMVWYAFMLDDEEYSQACRESEDPRVQQLCFPWLAIKDALNTETMTLKIPRAAEILFSTMSSQSADVLEYLNAPPAYAESAASPFNIDLGLQVHEQQSFIDEAHSHLWIRSPALHGSLYRSTRHYLRAQLMGQSNANGSLTTMFGTHLVWRTHRLFPAQYQHFCRTAEMDVCDSSSDLKATTSGETAGSDSQQSEVTDPEVCICWICERIRDESAEWRYDRTTKFYDAKYIDSISSDQLFQIRDDVGYYRAVEDNRRHGLPLPTRPLTAAEKEAEKLEAKRQKELKEMYDLFEVLPNGKKRFRIRKSLMNAYMGGV
jgi:hypothetical protein